MRLIEEQFDVPAQMVDAGGGNLRSVFGLG